MQKLSKEYLEGLVARLKEKKRLEELANPKILEPDPEPECESEDNNELPSTVLKSIKIDPTRRDYSTEPGRSISIYDQYGNLIELNEKQSEFVRIASNGKSIVLVGAAGTGKTTCQKAVVQYIIDAGGAGILSAGGHSHLISGNPGIIICSYTRRSVANIRRNMPEDLKDNCLTIHKLLEYCPIYYDVTDPNTGETKQTMRFEATRHRGNPLPDSIRTIIIEEASMVSVELFKQIIDALGHEVQFIFLGDIQQLKPAFGSGIIGFKLLELPAVELTQVYRQALESPIIRLAHRILSAKPIPVAEYVDWKFPKQLTLHPWKKKISDLDALHTVAIFLSAAFDNGLYNPEEDIILIPYNKSFGTIELNKHIANHLAKKRGAVVHQIVNGFVKEYFAVGDRVMYDKEDAIITRIDENPAYSGAAAMKASKTLDYWGHDHNPKAQEIDEDFDAEDAIDTLLGRAAMQSGDAEERVNFASHIITLNMLDSEKEVRISRVGDINLLSHGYAITVHKAQGSEWRKVFFFLHQTHAKMTQRELLYTGVTRAREELYIICEPETFTKGILSQQVKGNTLEEKAEYFRGKKAELYDDM